MRVSWERLGNGIDELFQPSGPSGTHAAHHYHGPVEPDVRERVLATVVVDYESSLMYLDVALQLSVEVLSEVGALGHRSWKRLVTAAESNEEGFAVKASEIILYLQRTPLYVRNDAIVHPRSMVPMTSHDNVGNLSLYRFSQKAPSRNDLAELNDLVHSVRQDIRTDAIVGRDIDPKLALNWLGTRSYEVDDWRSLNKLRETFGFLLPGAYEIGPKVDEMVRHFIEAVPPTDLADIVFSVETRISHPGMADGETVPAPSTRMVSDEDYEAQLNAGIAAGNAGDYMKAAHIFKACVELDPEDRGPHFQLAQTLSLLDQPTEALKHLYKAQALGGVDMAEVQTRLITAHFNVAVAAYNEKNYKSAIAHYTRAHHLDPNDLETQRRLMSALSLHGEFDAALFHAGILLHFHRDVPEVQLDVTRLFLSAGEWSRALHHAEAALELKPDWPEASALRDLAQCSKLRKAEDD